MVALHEKSKHDQEVFDQFSQEYALSPLQIEQFKMLLATMKEAPLNITAIENTADIIDLHFKDSLALRNCFNMETITMIADIGSGGGFPGIPLKIYYPQLKVVLIEVNTKKIEYLQALINKLQLEGIEVVGMDWRTFLRKTSFPIDLFMARASLQMDELLRMFQPSSIYNKAVLVYWASRHFIPEAAAQKLIFNECEYTVHHKKRRLLFFKRV